jgi:molybdopterin molybdotransferase
MITYDRALRAILERTAPLPRRFLTIEKAAGSALASPVRAPWDLPRTDQSSVDGFGVRAADVAAASKRRPCVLTLAGIIRAGERARGRLRAGTAAKILTGASVPAGVEAVVMKEYCREGAGIVRIEEAVRPGENIRRRGEERRRGEIVLDAGTRVTPPVAGVLASFGIKRVAVHGAPRVATVTTGDELVPVGRKIGANASRMYDANSPALAAALAGLGIEERRAYRVKDDKAALTRTLRAALDANDIVITVGGISVGDYDYVKDVLAGLGVATVFWRVAVKPGKPIFFGLGRGRSRGRGRGRPTLVFGLPGNPVSALVTFHQFVKPAIRALMGERSFRPAAVAAVLRRELRKEADRLEWVRGVLSREEGALVVTPCRGQGSHMLAGLAGANCLIEFPHGATRLAAGSTVAVTPLSWRE